jgi:hypothetical protein
MSGDDVVLVFVMPPNTIDGQMQPIKQFFGIERIHLDINQTIEVFFPFSIRAALTIASDGSKWLHSGLYRIIIGQQQQQQQHIHTIELHGQSARWN